MDEAIGTRPAAFDAGMVSGIVGYRLRRAQVAVFQRFMAEFAEVGLTPAEYSALALIGANPGCKQTQIGAALGIKRANFVILVNGLEARRLTERRQPAGDRRSNALHLTRAGEKLLADAHRIQAAFEADTVRRLGGRAARDQLVALLDRLLPHHD